MEASLEVDPKIKPLLGVEAPPLAGQAQVIRTANRDLAMTTPIGRTIPLQDVFWIDNAVDLAPGQRVQYRMRPMAHPTRSRPILTGAGSPEVIVLESSSDE